MNMQPKTIGLLAAFAIAGAGLFAACDAGDRAKPADAAKPGLEQGADPGADRTEAVPRKQLYQCPMHSHIIRDKPGVCPICGMELVPIPEDADTVQGGKPGSASSSAAPAEPESPVVRLEAATIRNIGVRTEPVRARVLERSLRLNGKVAVDEARIYSVTARVDGYVETLAATSLGRSVEKGETLLELYSPELVTAQQEYLQGGENGSGARDRLLNWGVSPRFLARLEKTREIRRRIPVPSPATGVVTRKEVVQGQAVGAGMEMFRIADLSEVWVTARVFPSDLPWVKGQAEAAIRIRSLPGLDFNAKVTYVSPELDPVTRTAEVRMKLANTPGRDLRPEMFADIVIAGENDAPSLAVPAQSLIRTGERNVAVVALGAGRFQPREVRIGRETGAWIEILDGLSEGEQVVTSAQFLIDAESNLRAAVAALQNASASGEAGHVR